MRRSAPEEATRDVVIRPTDPGSPEARWCLDRYYQELAERFEEGFQSARSIVTDPLAFTPPRGVFLVGRAGERAVACGAVTLTGPQTAYIKRMWVDGSTRGVGLGRRMLAALEASAMELGCVVVQLETNRSLTGAIRLYRSSGYAEVEPFNDEFYAHHWFEKRLDRE